MGSGMSHLKIILKVISTSQNCRFLHPKKVGDWGNYSMFPSGSPVKAAVVVGTKLIPAKVAHTGILSRWHCLFMVSLRRCHNGASVLMHLVEEASTRKPGRRGWPRPGSSGRSGDLI